MPGSPSFSYDEWVLWEQFKVRHPDKFPTKDSGKWYLLQRHQNGLADADAVRIRQRRFWVHPERYLEWYFSREHAAA